MIRPVTCVCMLLAASSGLYLYQTKHRTRMLDKNIEQTLAATETVHERIRLLNAEWALLNDPSRLGDLAGKFLTLRPVAPGQFVTVADLDKHLPPVREYPPSGALPSEPAAEAPLLPIASAPPAHPNTPIAVATPAPSAPPHPVMVASTAAAKPAPHGVNQTTTPSVTAETVKPETPLAVPAPRLMAHAVPAERHDQPDHVSPDRPFASRRDPVVATLSAPRQATTPSSLGAVAGPMPTPVSNPVMMNPVLSRVMATNAQPVSNNAVPSISRVGFASSALGNARTTLAPPVPVSPGAMPLTEVR